MQSDEDSHKHANIVRYLCFIGHRGRHAGWHGKSWVDHPLAMYILEIAKDHAV
jgi:hypothetical protein